MGGFLAAQVVPEAHSPPSHLFPLQSELIVLVQLLLGPLRELDHRSSLV